jgi:hypothetical protein
LTMERSMICETCGGDLFQKNRLVLLVIGLLLLTPIVFVHGGGVMTALSFCLALIGAYFLVWSILARGRWCRNCKQMARGA